MLTVGMAAVLAIVALVGVAALAGVNRQGSATADRQGMMPEVVVTAEMPRLVMPTVEVRAFRSVAMGASSLNVY